mgnify:CR=1 FL=1
MATEENENNGEAPIQNRGFVVRRKFTRASTIHHHVYEPIDAARVDQKSILCGLTAGVIQAGIFTPFDRALFLSIANRTPLFSVENFKNPFVGFAQNIGGRALSGGLYFPLEQFFFRKFHEGNKRDNSKWTNFAAGTAAGAVNAMILNPLSTVKYKTWSRMYNRGMVHEAFSMLQKGGHGVFFKGLTPTLLRDVTFGGFYTFIRLQAQYTYDIPPEHQWMANLLAASLATVASGPFNLARNIQYNTKSAHAAPTVTEVLMELVHEVKQIEKTRYKLSYVQNRLRIGWGTARVAMGIAFGHWVYDGLHAVVH